MPGCLPHEQSAINGRYVRWARQEGFLLRDSHQAHGRAHCHRRVGYIKSQANLISSHSGTTCRPYPVWRLPGWNRLSAGLHLDDLRKFFEDPDGGRDYTEALTQVSSGDTVGCGYEFTSGALFFTYNGQRLANAFTGIYLPRHNHDVFAAIGVEGRNDFEVNFGAELFRWKEGNEWAWLTEGSVGGQMSGGPSDAGDELPSYNDANSSTAFT